MVWPIGADAIKFIKTKDTPKASLQNNAKCETTTVQERPTEPYLQQFIQLTSMTSIIQLGARGIDNFKPGVHNDTE